MTPKEIEPRLLQGGYISAIDATELEALGVTDVLNLDIPYQNADVLEATKMRFHVVSLHDMTPLTRRDVVGLLDLFHSIMKSPGSKLYVHCNAGISRSPTAIWLYLVSTGLSREAATRMVEPDGVLLTREAVETAERYRRTGT